MSALSDWMHAKKKQFSRSPTLRNLAGGVQVGSIYPAAMYAVSEIKAGDYYGAAVAVALGASVSLLAAQIKDRLTPLNNG